MRRDGLGEGIIEWDGEEIEVVKDVLIPSSEGALHPRTVCQPLLVLKSSNSFERTRHELSRKLSLVRVRQICWP